MFLTILRINESFQQLDISKYPIPSLLDSSGNFFARIIDREVTVAATVSSSRKRKSVQAPCVCQSFGLFVGHVLC